MSTTIIIPVLITITNANFRWKGMRRSGVLPRERLEPGHRYSDTHVGIEAPVQVHGAGALPVESEL